MERSRMDQNDSAALLKISGALPKDFPFYHLGEVKKIDLQKRQENLPTDELLSNSEEYKGIAFSFDGEVRGLMLLLLDPLLDSSIYSEVGNVIASRVADQLDALISPPRELGPAQLSQIVHSTRQIERHTYLHLFEKNAVEIEVLIITNPQDSSRNGAVNHA